MSLETNKTNYFYLSKDNIVFYVVSKKDPNKLRSIANENLSKFLIETYLACKEVTDNSDPYELLETKLQSPLSYYPIFSSYLKKYQIYIANPVFPDESYVPPFSEIQAVISILDKAWSELLSSSSKVLKQISELDTIKDFGSSNRIHLAFFDGDYISLISIDSFVQLILYSVVHSIHEGLPTPKFCSVCDTPFIPSKSNQIYCSKKCKKADLRFKHPLESKIDSRSHMINNEVGINKRKADLFEIWKKEARDLRGIYEPEVFKEIVIAERTLKHSPLTKAEFNSLKSVKEFTAKIKDLWVKIKKEHPANAINQEN